MSVYVVSWGVARGDDRVELDSIVHNSREAAQKEYDLVDPATVGTGKMARLRDEGWEGYCSLTEVSMLDEAERPTDDVNRWTFDGSTEELAVKRG